jgi:hypothetical protein
MMFSRVALVLSVGSFILSPCHGETLPVISLNSARNEVTRSAATDELVPQTAIYYVRGGAGAGIVEADAYLLVEPAEFKDLSVGDIVMVADAGGRGVVAHRLVRQRNGTWTTESAGRTLPVTAATLRGRVYGVIPATS